MNQSCGQLKDATVGRQTCRDGKYEHETKITTHDSSTVEKSLNESK